MTQPTSQQTSSSEMPSSLFTSQFCFNGVPPYSLLVPAASGVESVVKRELVRLGYNPSPSYNGRIEVLGDGYDIARLNMWLRSGERVLLVLQRFTAHTFDELYSNLRAYQWQDIMPCDARILLYGKSTKSALGAIKSITSVAKKAIIDSLTAHYGVALTEKGARYMIEVAFFDNVATVTLDTSGDGLHKRGYRSLAYTAPIKETLAHAMIDLSFFSADKPFADPCCGSGTLPIEAALIATNRAPGIKRQFDYQHFSFLPHYVYQRSVQEAEMLISTKPATLIRGSDISPAAISLARYHAKCAGVADSVQFTVADAAQFSSTHSFGVMISNLPYALRTGEVDLPSLYASLKGVASRLNNWNYYFLTPDQQLERYFGRRCDKKRKLYNANIECTYYTFASRQKPSKGNAANTYIT